MKKIIVIGAIVLISGSLLTYSVGKTIHNLEKTNDENIRIINELNDSSNNLNIKINELEEEINIDKEKINTLVQDKELITQEKESLQDQINEMMKEVSYNPNNLTQLSGATEYHIKKMLKNTSMECLSDSFINIENDYGINVVFIMSLIANESAWNTSYAANTYNNLSGFAHYNRASRGSIFQTKEDCINTTSKTIKNNYLDDNGQYYNGKSIYGVNTKYSQLDNGQPNPNWSKTINSIAGNLVKKANK